MSVADPIIAGPASNPFESINPVRDFRRQLTARLVVGVTALLTILASAFLLYLILFVAWQGARFINLDFFTQIPAAYGDSGGGVAPAIVGSVVIVATAAAIGVPLGLFTGIYLAEFGRGALALAIRFMVDMLTGIPTIIFGLFIWVLIVVPLHSFSGFAGSIALAIVIVPIVARTTEEVLRQVSDDLREAAIALGATQSRTIWSVVVPSARNGIITGIILSLARAAGETAPLLLTAFGSEFLNTNLFRPMAALPLQIYRYTNSPYDIQIHQAYAAALIIMLLVIVASLLVRWATGGFATRGQ